MSAGARRRAGLCALAAALLAGGCGRVDDARPEPELVLMEADAGAVVSLPTGARLVVRLESNPSTGYRWAEVVPAAAALQASGEPAFEEPAARGGGVVGSPGHQVFRYDVVQAGRARVELAYARPWETGVPPVRKFDVTLIAR